MSETKLSAKQAQELLKAAGVAVEIVEDDAADFNADAILQSLDEARTPYIKPQIEQAIKDEVGAAAKGHTSTIYKTALAKAFKGAGIERRALDKIEDLDKMIEYVRDTFSSTFSKDTEALRAELESVGKKHAEQLEAQRAELEGKVKEVEGKFIDRDIEAALLDVVSAIPRTGGNPSVQMKQLKASLGEAYKLHYNAEKKAVELLDKETGVPVFANESKTAFLTPNDAAKTFFADLGVLATDSRGASPTAAMNNAQAQGAPPPARPQQTRMHNPMGGDDPDAAKLAQLLGLPLE